MLVHVLAICAQRNRKLELYTCAVLMSNALMGSGVHGSADPTPSPPNQSHVSPAGALSSESGAGSLAGVLRTAEFRAEVAYLEIDFAASSQI